MGEIMANHRGWWNLSVSNVDDDSIMVLSDCDLEHIAECIKNECTSGEIVKDEEDEEGDEQ